MTTAEDILAKALERQRDGFLSQPDSSSAVMTWFVDEQPTRVEVASVLVHVIDLLIEEANK